MIPCAREHFITGEGLLSFARTVCPVGDTSERLSAPLPSVALRANIPQCVAQIVPFFSDNSPHSVRSFRGQALAGLRGRVSNLETERARERRGAGPHCRPFGSKLHLTLIREVLAHSGVDGGSWVDQFGSGSL